MHSIAAVFDLTEDVVPQTIWGCTVEKLRRGRLDVCSALKTCPIHQSLEDSLGLQGLAGVRSFIATKSSAAPSGVGGNARCRAVRRQYLVAILPLGHRPTESLPGVETSNIGRPKRAHQTLLESGSMLAGSEPNLPVEYVWRLDCSLR